MGEQKSERPVGVSVRVVLLQMGRGDRLGERRRRYSLPLPGKDGPEAEGDSGKGEEAAGYASEEFFSDEGRNSRAF